MDDYYLDRDTLPREADGSLDLESIHTLDLPRLQQDICRLLAGEEVETPVFNFTTGKRKPKAQQTGWSRPAPDYRGHPWAEPLAGPGLPERFTASSSAP